jgi:hypothetical protein
MNRKFSAYMATRTNSQFGGTYADSRTFYSLHRDTGAPKNLGVIDTEVFSKQVNSDLLNKPMTFRAGKNFVELGASNHGKVRWQLAMAGVPRARIVDVDPNLGSYPGQAGTKFRVALNVGYYHEPILLKTEKLDEPRMRILGYPQQESTDKYWYDVELQTGTMTDFISPASLAIGKTVKDAGTSVSDEMNQKYAGLEFGSTSDYAAQISYFARKFEVTDRFIRLEIEARKGKTEFSGATVNKGFGETGHMSAIVGAGYVVGMNGASDEQLLKKGRTLTTIEYMLSDRIMMDREMDMYWGRTQTSEDPDSSYQRLNGSGWFQAAKEGNYDTHDGVNITLQDIVGKIQSLKFNVDDPKGNVVEIETGTAGMMLVNYLIGVEASSIPFTFSTNYFIDKAASNMTKDGLSLGYQFVEYHQFGRVYRFVWNPCKDNLDWYPERDPETNMPLESQSFDVFSLTSNNDALGNKNNIGLAHEPEAYEYFTVSNVYDFYTGSIKNGANATDDRKEAYVRRAINGSAIFFDVSSTFRFQRV